MNPASYFMIAAGVLVVLFLFEVLRPKQASTRRPKIFADREDRFHSRDQLRVDPSHLDLGRYTAVDNPTSPCCDRPMVRVVGSTLVCAGCTAPFRRAVWVTPQPLYEGEWEKGRVFSGRAPETGSFLPVVKQQVAKLRPKRRKKRARSAPKIAQPAPIEENPS